MKRLRAFLVGLVLAVGFVGALLLIARHAVAQVEEGIELVKNARRSCGKGLT